MGNKQSITNHKNIQEWVSLYADDLFRWALHKTGDKELAKDLVQETFLAAFKSIDKFQGKSKPKTWLLSIMNNKIIDFYRKNFREATINQSQLNKGSDDSNVFENFFDSEGTWRPDAKPTNWQEIDGHLLDDMEFRQVLQDCLKDLPANWSSAIHFKYLENKDAKEICKDLGISTSNYWQILHRAKLQLRLCINKNWT